MNDLLNLKLSTTRQPLEKTVNIDGVDYKAHFIPLTRREFDAIQKKEFADDHLIAASWCDETGNKRLQSAADAGEFPPIAHARLVQAALEACGFGKQAHADAKKD